MTGHLLLDNCTTWLIGDNIPILAIRRLEVGWYRDGGSGMISQPCNLLDQSVQRHLLEMGADKDKFGACRGTSPPTRFFPERMEMEVE